MTELPVSTSSCPNSSYATNWIHPKTGLTVLVGDTWSHPVASVAVHPVYSNLSLSRGLCLCAPLLVPQQPPSETQTHLSFELLRLRLTRHPDLCRHHVRSLPCGGHVSLKNVLRDKICTPSRMGEGVAHWFGSNIVDRGFTCTQYNVNMGAFGEAAQKSRSNPCCRAINISSWDPMYLS